MRVILVCPSWGRVCGIASYTRHLREGLEALGVASDVATTPASLKGLLEGRDCSAVLIQHEYGLYYFNLIAVLNLAERSGLPLVITMHNSDHRGWMGAQHLFLFKTRAKIVVHSQVTRENLLRGPLAPVPDRLFTIPMGCPDFEGQFGPVDEVRREMGLSANGFLVGFFGFAAEHKGIPNLITALLGMSGVAGYVSASIHPVNPHAVDRIYEATGLTRRPGETGTYDNVVISHAWIPDEKLGRYHNAMDVIVLPYSMHGESVSASMMGRVALASGRPTVVTAVPYFGGLEDAVLTIEDAKPETITKAVEALRASPELRATMARRATKYARENSWPRVAQGYLDLL